MAVITMLALTRAAGYTPGIYEVEDSPTIRWLLKSDRFELIDPPDLAWLDNPELEAEAASGYNSPSPPPPPPPPPPVKEIKEKTRRSTNKP